MKIDKNSFNGTYHKDNNFFRCQWYEGCGMYYIIFNDNAAEQGSVSFGQLKNIIKDGWAK